MPLSFELLLPQERRTAPPPGLVELSHYRVTLIIAFIVTIRGVTRLPNSKLPNVRTPTLRAVNEDAEQRRQRAHLSRSAPARRWATCCGATGCRRCSSEELPEPDCAAAARAPARRGPIAFRDTTGAGRPDAEAACPHRGASLFFGRNEEGGLRCVYHGWKFDVAGACVDMPNEPRRESTSSTRSRPSPTRARSAAASSGPTWARPSASRRCPELEWDACPPTRRYVVEALRGVQLGAGAGGRHRLQPRLVPAQRSRQPDPIATRRQRRFEY